jgi:hypothetical protein
MTPVNKRRKMCDKKIRKISERTKDSGIAVD